MKLIGKFFFHDFGETYSTGRIVDVLTDFGMVLVQMDSVVSEDAKVQMPILFYDIGEFLERLPDGRPMWNLFHTRHAMNAFLHSVGEPFVDNVIQLRR